MIVSMVGKCKWCERHKQKLILCCEPKEGELKIMWLCEKCKKSLEIKEQKTDE